MPIEIRELVIRVTVGEAPTAAGAAGAAGGDSGAREASIVAECVEQVLDSLERREER